MYNQYDNSTANLRESFFSEDRSNPVHERFLEHVGKAPKGSRILDIGTGNGYILREIQKKYPGRYQLIGTDNSSEMLAEAKSFGGDMHYKLADNYHLPFKDNYFTTVTAKNVTRFSVEELARVLQTEGLFVYREYGKGKGLVEVASCFPDRLIRSRDPSFYSNQFAEFGFEDIEVHQYTLKKEYDWDELLRVVQMFPFIEDLSNTDLETIKNLFEDKTKITITSDPFILTAKRKAR